MFVWLSISLCVWVCRDRESGKTQDQPAANLLLGDCDEEDSSSESTDDGGGENALPGEELDSAADRLPNPLADDAPKLPRPVISKRTGSTSTGSIQHSVFVTPFQKAEAAKDSILEQHVKMTSAELKKEKGGKKVCWNYRKGKCHKGSKCKFAHDNDIVQERTENSAERQDVSSQASATQHHHLGYYGNESFHQPFDANCQSSNAPDDDSFSTEQRQKKKRVGMRDHLVPPKRAMQALQKQREEERPWTMSK